MPHQIRSLHARRQLLWTTVGISVSTLVLAVLWLATSSDAQVQPRSVRASRSAIASSSDQLQSAREQLDTARQQARSAAQSLETWLSTADARVVDAWKNYLQWDQLQQQLARSQPDPVALRALLDRFYRNQPGLEKPQFLALRESLQHYSDLATALRATMLERPGQAAPFGARDLLAERIERYANHPTADQAHAIARQVGQLRLVHGPSHPLVAAADERLDRPNGYIQISRSFIAGMLERPITHSCSVDEELLGTVSHGTATTRGQVTVEFQPSDRRGVLDICLRGQTVMDDNVATKGPATIYSSTRTQVEARKRVEFDATGLDVTRTRAHCTTDMSIDNIAADRALIERIAWRRAEKMQPELQQAASRKAEQRVEEMFDEEANVPLVKAQDFLMSQFRHPLLRMGAFPETFRFSTRPGYLRVTIRQREAFQLAAPNAPPAIDPTDDMSFLVHQSLLNNSTERLLGGRTLDDKQLLEFMKILTGSSPRPLWVHERADRWAAVCADERPLEMEFRDGRITITFRLQGIDRDGEHAQVPVSVAGTFAMASTIDGVKLTRQGDLDIAVGRPDESASQNDELYTFVRRKFRGVLMPEIYFDGLVPPAGSSWDRLRNLAITRLDARDGWLTIAYRRTSGPLSPIASSEATK